VCVGSWQGANLGEHNGQGTEVDFYRGLIEIKDTIVSQDFVVMGAS